MTNELEELEAAVAGAEKMLRRRNRQLPEKRRVFVAEDDDGPWCEVIDTDPDGSRWVHFFTAPSRLEIYKRILDDLVPSRLDSSEWKRCP